MLDKDGYRANVGIILVSKNKEVFWGRRKGENSWQFPQGGIYENELPDEAMYRELNEEVGLGPNHVRVLAKTQKWLYYDVPEIYNRHSRGNYKGQKQIWYLLDLLAGDYNIDVKMHKEQEFDAWRWVDYWFPLNQVVPFKRNVYDKALTELSCFFKAEIIE